MTDKQFCSYPQAAPPDPLRVGDLDRDPFPNPFGRGMGVGGGGMLMEPPRGGFRGPPGLHPQMPR
jgi:hypothetical protein